MIQLVKYKLSIASAVFVVLIGALPLIAYYFFFSERMHPDPHGVGAFLFILFSIVLSPLFSLLCSVTLWVMLWRKAQKFP